MNLSVIGCGYVGLVTAACLAEAGHHVICTDVDTERIAALNAGIVPIYEQHLDAILASAKKAGRISYTTDAAEAIRGGDAIFICVGTPPKENGDADLSAIDHVARQIAEEARSSKLVIEKSTVPARTGLELQRALGAYSRNGEIKFHVASNPEFLREGTAVSDFFHPDRIVVGVEDDSAAAQLREIYSPILERRFHCPVHEGPCPADHAIPFLVTTINSAELIKHASNSFLALKISYANVIADLCEKIGADVDEVTHAMGLDPAHRRPIPQGRSGVWRILFSQRRAGFHLSFRFCRRGFHDSESRRTGQQAAHRSLFRKSPQGLMDSEGQADCRARPGFQSQHR